MHRAELLDILVRYESRHPDERAMVQRIRTLVTTREDCFERACLPGHLTASSFIFSHDRTRFLLTHHRRLDRWLQLGGHADGDPDLLAVALREAREESGMHAFSIIDGPGGRGEPRLVRPVDVDVHRIPENRREPAHEHHDVRFVLVAAPDQPLVMSDESFDLAWFPLEAIGRVDADESLLRLGRKAIALRAEPARPLVAAAARNAPRVPEARTTPQEG